MSHFTVLVIGENPSEQLAPFQENNMGDCPEKYLEFVDTEDEFLEEFNTQSRDGKSLKEIYTTFEEYVKDCYESKRDSRKNRFGHWANPNAKWDWYQLGGRWSPYFKLKDGGSSDQAMKSEIDFEAMRKKSETNARKHWQKVHDILNKYPDFKFWVNFHQCEGFDFKNSSKEQLEDLRKRYRSQPGQDEMKEVLGFFEETSDLLLPEDEYARLARNDAISTHAVLKDGKWYERGEMGWWGMVTNEKDHEAWAEEFNKYLDSLSEDTMLSIYDCHI